MFQLIKKALAKIWDILKKIVLRIISFIKNIVSFFKNPRRLSKLQEDQDTIAVVIKEKLADGDYQVVNCLFNKEEGTLVNPEEDALVMTSGELDNTTQTHFKGKDMLVLQ